MPIGNRYELIDFQSLHGEDVLNVYFYLQISGVAGGADDCAQAWEINMLTPITGIQSSELTHTAIGCRNLDVPTDFVVRPRVPATPGATAGSSEPRWLALAFKFARMEQGVRHGWKRFAGVPDANIVSGIVDGPLTTLCQNLAVTLDNDWLGPSGAVYEPRIMRRLLDPLGHLIGYEDHPMGLCTFQGLSSQNTRKR